MELSVIYAALILNDEGMEITADKLKTLLDAAGVTIESYWIDMFADFLAKQDLEEMIKGTNLGGAGPAAAVAGGEAAAEEKAEEKKEEEAAAMDMDLGDMFGDDW